MRNENLDGALYPSEYPEPSPEYCAFCDTELPEDMDATGCPICEVERLIEWEYPIGSIVYHCGYDIKGTVTGYHHSENCVKVKFFNTFHQCHWSSNFAYDDDMLRVITPEKYPTLCARA